MLYTSDSMLSPAIKVSADDPRVVQVVKDAENTTHRAHFEITTEMYMKALKKGIWSAEQRKKEADPTGPL